MATTTVALTHSEIVRLGLIAKEQRLGPNDHLEVGVKSTILFVTRRRPGEVVTYSVVRAPDGRKP